MCVFTPQLFGLTSPSGSILRSSEVRFQYPLSPLVRVNGDILFSFASFRQFSKALISLTI